MSNIDRPPVQGRAEQSSAEFTREERRQLADVWTRVVLGGRVEAPDSGRQKPEEFRQWLHDTLMRAKKKTSGVFSGSFPSLPASGGGRGREGEARIGRRESIRYADFWNADLSDADVVYCFLMPKVYPKLKEKLERECRSGTRVILYVWPMAGWGVDAMDVAPRAPKLYRHVLR